MKIYEKLRKGENFSDLANKFSEDKATAVKGGNIPWFGVGKMVKEFENAAISLQSILPTHKIDPKIQNKEYPEWALKNGKLSIIVLLYKNADFINNYGLSVGLHADKISNKTLKLFKNSIYKALNSLKKDNLNEN